MIARSFHLDTSEALIVLEGSLCSLDCFKGMIMPQVPTQTLLQLVNVLIMLGL